MYDGWLVLLFAAVQYISTNITVGDNKDITETLREMQPAIIFLILYDVATEKKDLISAYLGRDNGEGKSV